MAGAIGTRQQHSIEGNTNPPPYSSWVISLLRAAWGLLLAIKPWKFIQHLLPTGRNAPITQHGAYEYTSLRPDSMQIRVLSILPWTSRNDQNGDKEPLRCTMKIVDLEDYTNTYRAFLAKTASDLSLNSSTLRANHWHGVIKHLDGSEKRRFTWGEYVALSYTWGDPTNRRDIFLDDHKFSVTASLHEALVSLRRGLLRAENFYVWADALCINQADLVERATEVKKMACIYSQCMWMVSWLGRPSSEASRQLSKVEDFVDTCRKSFGNAIIREHLQSSKTIRNALKDRETARALVAVAFDLFRQPYWERMWIVQELALSPSTFFVYGTAMFEIVDLLVLSIEAMEVLSAHAESDATPQDGSAYMDWLKTRDAKAQEIEKSFSRENLERFVNRTLTLLQGSIFDTDAETRVRLCVEICRFSKATDERDKVYGLLGILPPTLASMISHQASYDASNTVVDVYRLFSRICFEADKDLFLLPRVTPTLGRYGAEDEALDRSLPSWAFDLSTPSAKFDVDAWKKIDKRHAANQSMPKCQFGFSDDNYLLHCDGVIVDEILWQLKSPNTSPWKTYSAWLETFPNARESAGPRPQPSKSFPPDQNTYRDCKDRPLDNPSIFDIPWLDWPDQVSHEPIDRIDNPSWSAVFQTEEFEILFCQYLWNNGGVNVGGKPLEDWFSSLTANSRCPNPDAYRKLARNFSEALSQGEIFTTRAGLLGTTKRYAWQQGDVVAVLANCDMPLILRPKGDYFEFKSGCIVQGLMDGEVGRAIEEGKLQIRKVTLC